MKKTFLGLLLTLFASGLAAKPNAVFFFIDDMGWTDLGFMGSKYYESPRGQVGERRNGLYERLCGGSQLRSQSSLPDVRSVLSPTWSLYGV